MADRHGNVVVLPGLGGAGQVQREHLDALRAIAGQLDELSHSLQELSPRPGWSAKRCMIASTPFRMRLASVERGLCHLIRLNAFHKKDALHVVFQLNDTCQAARLQLDDIQTCLEMLHNVEISSAERAREADLFASRRSGLLAVLSEIRQLIVMRFTGTLAEN